VELVLVDHVHFAPDEILDRDAELRGSKQRRVPRPVDQQVDIAPRSGLAASDGPKDPDILGPVFAGQPKELSPVRAEDFGNTESRPEMDGEYLWHIPVPGFASRADARDSIPGAPRVDATVAMNHSDLSLRHVVSQCNERANSYLWLLAEVSPDTRAILDWRIDRERVPSLPQPRRVDSVQYHLEARRIGDVSQLTVARHKRVSTGECLTSDHDIQGAGSVANPQ